MATQYVDNIAKPESHPFGIATPTVVRTISLSDLSEALRLGWEDFKAVPSHAIILCVMYPVLGLSCSDWCLVIRCCRCSSRSPQVLR